MRPLQQIVGGLQKILEAGSLQAFPGDEDNVPARLYPAEADCFPQSTLYFVPDHRIANPLANNEPEPALVEVVGEEAEHQITIYRSTTVPVDLGKPSATSEAEPALHDREGGFRLSTDGAL